MAAGGGRQSALSTWHSQHHRPGPGRQLAPSLVEDLDQAGEHGEGELEGGLAHVVLYEAPLEAQRPEQDLGLGSPAGLRPVQGEGLSQQRIDRHVDLEPS
jgi:hypothetical protein